LPGIVFFERSGFSVATYSQGINSLLNNMGPLENEWLTAEEAAAYLKVQPRTLLSWARQRKVKGFALSGTKRRVWRFRRADLDAALTATSVLSSTSPCVLNEGRMI